MINTSFVFSPYINIYRDILQSILFCITNDTLTDYMERHKNVNVQLCQTTKIYRSNKPREVGKEIKLNINLIKA